MKRWALISESFGVLSRAVLVGAMVVAFAPVAEANGGGSGVTYVGAGDCGKKVSGNVVLTSDIICVDMGSGAGPAPGGLPAVGAGLVVIGPNTIISFRGYSIKCYDPKPSGPDNDDFTSPNVMKLNSYKNSCQGDYTKPSGYADTGIDTCGYSNVQMKGPGMVQGFTIGIHMRGAPPVDATGPCGAGAVSAPHASNVKTQKLNITGPDGRADISDPFPGTRPKTWGILVRDFTENASTCSKPDSDDGHTHGVEVFGNAVDNHMEGIALYNASRVMVHQNFAHDNNNAGDVATSATSTVIDPLTGLPVPTATVIAANRFESHGIVVCGEGQAFCYGLSRRNKIQNNLVVDNGENAHCNDPNTDGTCTTGNNDGGVTLTGKALNNDVKNNTSIGNNGDGISLRNGADWNKISSNSMLYNTSTDSSITGYDPVTGMPTTAYFWDLTQRAAGPNNIKSNNRCLTQSPSVSGTICGPGENDWWK
jgi:hypothetical protein